ncbi:hypothetical protein GCM10023187_29240 [Nibrella viscosa]|uniref:PIN domain-containing protein n=1 Tax=Nibrella viscosa TaxID=1084524 RepID=A0ABP8KJ99_9BACT
MTLFLDTNVVLAWLLDRQDTYSEEATTVFLAAEQKRVTLYVSAGSVYTVAYVLHKSGRRSLALRNDLQAFLSLVEVAPADKQTFIAACWLGDMKDLEDAFQYQTALKQTGIDYFVTGNIRDFIANQHPELPVLTPAEMVQKLKA